MTEPFIAEIRIFAGNFAPHGWAMCDGQIMAISQNTALFSLVGTNYGGNGTQNFGLPNLQGSAPMHQGNGPGLTPRNVGETGGSETVTLLTSEMPQHNHLVIASSSVGDNDDPQNMTLAQPAAAKIYKSGTPTLVNLPSQAIGSIGSGSPHNNMQPFLTLTFIIALTGIFPARN